MTPALQTVPRYDGLSAGESAKIHAIMEAVSSFTGVDVASLVGERRTARIAQARHLAMAAIRHTTKLSLMEVGEIFHRDHGTVIHAIRAVNNRVATCADTKALYEELTPRPERQ